MLKQVEKAYRSLDKMKDCVSEKKQELEVERRILFETQKQLDRAKRRNVVLFIVCLIILVAYRMFLSYQYNTLYPFFFFLINTIPCIRSLVLRRPLTSMGIQLSMERESSIGMTCHTLRKTFILRKNWK